MWTLKHYCRSKYMTLGFSIYHAKQSTHSPRINIRVTAIFRSLVYLMTQNELHQAGADITGQLQVRPMLYTLYIGINLQVVKMLHTDNKQQITK